MVNDVERRPSIFGRPGKSYTNLTTLIALKLILKNAIQQFENLSEDEDSILILVFQKLILIFFLYLPLGRFKERVKKSPYLLRLPDTKFT